MPRSTKGRKPQFSWQPQYAATKDSTCSVVQCVLYMWINALWCVWNTSTAKPLRWTRTQRLESYCYWFFVTVRYVSPVLLCLLLPPKKKRTTLPKAWFFFWYFSNTGQIRWQANPMAMAGRLDFSCKRIFAFICNAFCRIKRVFPCPGVVNWVWVSGSVVEFRHSQGWELKKKRFFGWGKKRIKRFSQPPRFSMGEAPEDFFGPFSLGEKIPKTKEPFFGWGRNILLTQKTKKKTPQNRFPNPGHR